MSHRPGESRASGHHVTDDLIEQPLIGECVGSQPDEGALCADPELGDNHAGSLAYLDATVQGVVPRLRVARVGSQETYGLLVAEHGWTAADWAQRVERHVRAELFPAGDRNGTMTW